MRNGYGGGMPVAINKYKHVNGGNMFRALSDPTRQDENKRTERNNASTSSRQNKNIKIPFKQTSVYKPAGQSGNRMSGTTPAIRALIMYKILPSKGQHHEQ